MTGGRPVAPPDAGRSPQADAASGLAGLSVRRPLLALVANLLIVLAGVSAILGVEIRELPDIDRPVVSVRANFPGASPISVDAEAASLVEAAVARVAGVQSVRTSSEEGNFRLRAEFAPDADLIDAANDVREAVARVSRRLPDGVEDLFVVKADADAQPILSIAAASDSLAIDALTRLIETEIVPVFTAVEGVADVTLFGDRERVIRVAADPNRLAALDVSIADVAAVLRAADFDAPAGSFDSGEQEVLVRADGAAVRPDAIAALKLRGDVAVGDVAAVYAGPADPVSQVRVNGREVVVLGLIRQAKSNTVAISGDARAAAEALNARYDELNLTIISDDAVFIEGAIWQVLSSLALATAIVVGVVGVFIGRLGAAAIPAVAIPVALLGAVAAIWLAGFSLNLITLLALVLATGLVVDDAIVVLENIQRRRAEGLGPRAAAVIGARQVFFAVVATTAVLIAVFAPISLLPSSAGRLFREFGFVLAATVAISSFVALTMAPMIAARLGDLGGGAAPGDRSISTRLGDLYQRALDVSLRAPLATVAFFAVVAGGAGALYADLGQEISPSEDRGRVVMRAQGPDGVGLDGTDRQVAQMEALLTPFAEAGAVAAVYSVTGWFDPNRGRVEGVLAPWADREIRQQDIEDAIRPKLNDIPGARARVQSRASIQLRGSGDGVNLALTGDAYPDIAAAAEDFADVLQREIPTLRSIRVEYQATQPQISVTIDRARATELGVTMSDLADTLQALIDGDEVAEITVGDQATPVILQSSAGAVNDPQDLLNLTVPKSGGGTSPLAQLATLREEGVAAELDRHGQRRAVEIRTSLGPGASQGAVVAQIRDLAATHLPSGVGLLFLDDAAAVEETARLMAFTFAIAALVVFLVLVAQFESLVSALIVMATVPFGVCAAVAALWVSGQTLNIYSQIGVLMLIGVMAKNGVLLVEFADQLRDRGASALFAAREAARKRLRAISMTMLATILAGLPLILGSGPGSEARAAIGWVVVGGLGLASFATLFLTPAAYALLAGLTRPRAAEAERLAAEMAAAGECDGG